MTYSSANMITAVHSGYRGRICIPRADRGSIGQRPYRSSEPSAAESAIRWRRRRGRGAQSGAAAPAQKANRVGNVISGERAENRQRERAAHKVRRRRRDGGLRPIELYRAIGDAAEEEKRQGNAQMSV